MFSIPYDIDILEHVFRVKAEKESEDELAKRSLYNRDNKFFQARSLADVVAEVTDESERTKLGIEMERVKSLYNGLSQTYQTGKEEGRQTSSVWK